ncbi:MAG: hypothetical protein UZ21_OP11001000336 [Microgenomates bacterium OLB22]|nr:MAG: hypothetical protein UZ21_OP11001000336 [Microgenomates bacterium OLB22]
MVEKVKIFYTDSSLINMEKRINEWLASMEGKIEVTRVIQNSSATDSLFHIVITIWYRNTTP